MTAPAFVLASGSAVRRTLLQNAGVAFTAEAASLDEEALIASLQAEQAAPRDIAVTLADLKAQRVSGRHAGAFVLGADQLLVQDGAIFMKPANRDQARDRLQALRGTSHQLVCGLAMARDGAIIWRHTEVSTLTMRSFSDDWLEGYLDRNCPAILSSVGAYMLEGEGIHLFSRIQGDYFAILGLPLLPVLDHLRTHKVIES